MNKYTNTNPRSFKSYSHHVPERINAVRDISGFIFSDTKHNVDKIGYDPGSYVNRYPERVYRTSVSYTAKQILEDPMVMPYTIQSHMLTNKKFKQHIMSIWPYVISGFEVKPILFRIRDDIICDDFGRVFVYDRFTRSWDFRLLNLNTGREHTTILKRSLPSYYWPGIAGFAEDVQIKIVDTPSFEIHHVNENVFDLSPYSLAPVSASLHHDYIHYTSRRAKWYRWFNKGPRVWSDILIGYYVNW